MDSIDLSKQTSLWSKLSTALTERYTILDGCNLLYYDHDMSLLYNRLLPFKSRAFADHERIIFTLYDNEYYFQQSKIGFTIHNLIQILIELDISLSYCMLFTNHYGIADSIEQLCTSYKFGNQLTVHENNYSKPLSVETLDPVLPVYSSTDIKYHFAFLSYVCRDHRAFTRCFIHANNLDDKTLMSWHPPGHLELNFEGEFLDAVEHKDIDHRVVNKLEHVNLLYPVPFRRLNDKIFPDEELQHMVNNNSDAIYKFVKNDIINSQPNINNFDADFLRYSFANIVTETVLQYPYPYLSEKTFKNFVLLRPFVVVGSAGTLAQIKKLGFKTFDHWFDESYDTIEDPTDRLKQVFQTIDVISNWSLDHCQQVYNDMSEVLNYNYNHYVRYCNELYHQELEKIIS